MPTAHLGGGLLSRVRVPVGSGVVCPSAGDENVWALGQCWSQFCVSRVPVGSIPRPHSLASLSPICPAVRMAQSLGHHLSQPEVVEDGKVEAHGFPLAADPCPPQILLQKPKTARTFAVATKDLRHNLELPRPKVAEHTQRAIQSASHLVIRMREEKLPRNSA